jgi:glycosyltransferase involved in cell wall biosynthesis
MSPILFDTKHLYLRGSIQRCGVRLGLYMDGAIITELPINRITIKSTSGSWQARIWVPPPTDTFQAATGKPPCGFRLFEEIKAPKRVKYWTFNLTVDHSDGFVMTTRGQIKIPRPKMRRAGVPSVTSPVRKIIEDSAIRRIVAIAHNMGVGGAQWWLAEVTNEIRRRQGVYLASVECASSGHASSYHHRGLRRYETARQYTNHVRFCIKQLRQQSPDAVLINTVESLAYAEASRQLCLPFVWAIHESYRPAALWRSVFQLTEPPLELVQSFEQNLSKASALIFMSNETRQLYTGVSDVSHQYTIPFVLGSSSTTRRRRYGQARAAELARIGLDASASLFVSISSIDERKSLALLVRAFAIARRLRTDIHLVIAGPAQPAYSSYVDATIEELKLKSNVTFIKRPVDTITLLQLADVYVSASDIESRPVVLLEAMSLGLHIVAADACGINELLAHYKCRTICKSRDLASLAQALLTSVSSDCNNQLKPSDMQTQLGRTAWTQQIVNLIISATTID